MRYFIASLACLMCVSVVGQDVLITNEGEEVLVKVFEVSHDDIKYKKYSNLEGPIYTMFKSDVFMIKYENGERDVFNVSEIRKPIVEKEPKEEYQGEKTAIFIEAGGACAYGSISLDFMFVNTRVFRLGMRAGVGLAVSTANTDTLYTSLPNDSLSIRVVGLGIPLQLTCLLGNGSHFYEAGFGITAYADANTHLLANQGYRFQPANKNYFLKFNINFGYDLKDNDFFLIPGVSYGINPNRHI